jgi:hypothetical protein
MPDSSIKPAFSVWTAAKVRQPNTKAPVLIHEAAQCTGFNIFVTVPNFTVSCLMVRFFDKTGPRSYMCHPVISFNLREQPDCHLSLSARVPYNAATTSVILSTLPGNTLDSSFSSLAVRL